MSILVRNTLKRKLENRRDLQFVHGEVGNKEFQSEQYSKIMDKLNTQIQMLQFLVTKENLGETE